MAHTAITAADNLGMTFQLLFSEVFLDSKDMSLESVIKDSGLFI